MKCGTSRDTIIDNDGVCPGCSLGIKFAKFHRARPQDHDQEGDGSPGSAVRRRREGPDSTTVTSPRTTTAAAEDPLSRGTFAAGPCGVAETASQRAWRLLGELAGSMSDDHPRTRDGWTTIKAACFGETAASLFRNIRVDTKGKPLGLETVYSLMAGIPVSQLAQMKTNLDAGSRAARAVLIGYASRRQKEQDAGAHRMVVSGFVDGGNKPRSAMLHGWLSMFGPESSAAIGVVGCDVICEHLLADVNHPVWWFLMLVLVDSDRRPGIVIDLVKRMERVHQVTYKDDLQTYTGWTKERKDEATMKSFAQTLASAGGGQFPRGDQRKQGGGGGGRDRGQRRDQQGNGGGRQAIGNTWRHQSDAGESARADPGVARDAAVYDNKVIAAGPQGGGARGGGRTDGRGDNGGGRGRGRGRAPQ